MYTKLKPVNTRSCYIVCGGLVHKIMYGFFNEMRRNGFKWHVHDGDAFIYITPTLLDPNNVLQEG
jgi:hypothetical protein